MVICAETCGVINNMPQGMSGGSQYAEFEAKLRQGDPIAILNRVGQAGNCFLMRPINARLIACGQFLIAACVVVVMVGIQDGG